MLNEVSARGLDLQIDVVFLWGLPAQTASYLHMAGRTGRAGRAGMVVSLVLPRTRARLMDASVNSKLTRASGRVPVSLRSNTCSKQSSAAF